MKLNIPIEVVFDDLNSMINELDKLQKYKLGEGDDMTLVDVCDVADILTRHVMAREAQSQRKKGKWIRTDRKNVYGGYELECPLCGDKVMVQNIERELYCRNCGADMRG